jgi:hypothetical protein
MNRYTFISLLIILSASPAVSQTVEQRSAFVSANLGGFVALREDFSKVYDSNLGFAFGGGLGLPLSSRMYLYGKATYFFKTGVPVIYTYTYQDGNLVSITERRDGTASFKQWIINGGLQYNVFLSEDYTFPINGGITYTRISEEQRSSSGSLSSSIDGTGILGLFGGVGVERNFQDSPFSVFAETQYNYSRRDILTAVGNYGGWNLTLGVRYYFKDRRRS